jgi:EAL domain-containing protein (putative c-di-GMP-specific phosphodiesterase class I)
VDEIRSGVERHEFTVHYQPVVRLADSRWSGAEALVRWQHPERGLLPPAAFIDAAERSGAIIDLGQLVLDDACRQWSTWQRAGTDLQIAVNLSGRQLADPNLADRVGGAMAAVSMPPGVLWLEVTETSLVEDLDQATNVLEHLVERGASITIDDFGTGWASLTYLREFPVHALKIDRVFVDGLGKSSPDAAIVSSIISLAGELELSVVAEGVETTEQRAHLRGLGCTLGQGYLFGPPQPPGQLVSR